MFEFLKNLFVSKPSDDYLGDDYVSGQELPPPHPAHQAPARPASPAPPPRAASRPHSNGSGVHVPLQVVLNGLPLELKARVRQSDVGDALISVPLEKVLSQLSSGAVKISFGELRRAAPQIFAKDADRDQLPVALPLNEILARINPALLVRRQNQKHVEVPEDITSPFGERGQGLIFSIGPSKAETPPVTREATPVAPIQRTPVRPQPAHPAPPPPIFTAPESPGTSMPFRNLMPAEPEPVPPAAVPPVVTPLPGLRGFGGHAAPPAPEPQAAFHPVPEGPSLITALSALAESWPEALRLEIVQLNLAEARMALPVAMIEEALKRGRVAFPWKVLRSWIRPAPLPTVSAHDNLSVELPLKVIAPLFLSHQKSAERPQHKTEIDESIPNLFFGFPQPPGAAPEPAPASAGPTHAVAKPIDTNYYVWDDSSESARVDETEFKRKPTPGTSFITRYATPNEVVSRAAALEGVAGALIALPDGLMVASKLSPDLNGDTLAAFLPQIFAKVSQCTKELRMGELNNLNFTVGNVPWKIFRVNAIFFAVFGRSSQPLPTTQLVALAAELDRKK